MWSTLSVQRYQVLPQAASKGVQKICKYGEHCAYEHIVKDQSKGEVDELVEDIKNIKAELDILKNTVKSLSQIKEEGKVIKKSIHDLKADIKK